MCVVNSYYVGASFMCARLYVRVPKAINHDQLDRWNSMYILRICIFISKANYRALVEKIICQTISRNTDFKIDSVIEHGQK